MVDERRVGLVCGILVSVLACLTWFVSWYNISYAPHEILYFSGDLISVEQDFELTKIITRFESTNHPFGWSVETNYSTLGDDDYEGLKTLMLIERAIVIAVAIVGVAIAAVSVFGKERFLTSLGVLAIALSVVGLVYFALAASGTDAELVGLSGASVFETEGFWGSSTESTFGPAMGWFLLIGVVVVSVCMMALLLRKRVVASEAGTATASEEVNSAQK
jgi:4-amino-4-deoxy-L-arabinose transferase-like glycosyltransferase